MFARTRWSALQKIQNFGKRFTRTASNAKKAHHHIFRTNLAVEESNAKVPTSATAAPLSIKESIPADATKDPGQVGSARMRADSRSVRQNCHTEYEEDNKVVARSSNCLRRGNLQ